MMHSLHTDKTKNKTKQNMVKTWLEAEIIDRADAIASVCVGAGHTVVICLKMHRTVYLTAGSEPLKRDASAISFHFLWMVVH